MFVYFSVWQGSMLKKGSYLMNKSFGYRAFVVDAHVHIYSCHDLGISLQTMVQRLLGVVPGCSDVLPVACLAEGASCNWFHMLSRGSVSLPDGFSLRTIDHPAGLWLETPMSPVLLIAGRQLVTSERLEVLALGIDALFPDGLQADAAIASVRAAGAVPVLSWAPGKWLFARGRVVRRLLAESQAGGFLLGDSSLRPLGWGEPALMREGRRLGFNVIAGSDPLPLPNEEKVLGSYGCVLNAPCDMERPFASFREALQSRVVEIRLVGRRRSPLVVAYSLMRHAINGAKCGSK